MGAIVGNNDGIGVGEGVGVKVGNGDGKSVGTDVGTGEGSVLGRPVSGMRSIVVKTLNASGVSPYTDTQDATSRLQ